MCVAQLSGKEAKHKEQVSQLQQAHQRESLQQAEEHTAKEEVLMSRVKESREHTDKLEKVRWLHAWAPRKVRERCRN